MKSVRTLFAVIKDKKAIILLNIVLSIGISISAISASFIATCMTNFIIYGDRSYINDSLILTGLLFLSLLIYYFGAHYANKATLAAGATIRTEVAKAFIYSKMDMKDRTGKGKLTSNITTDVDHIVNFLLNQFRDFVQVIVIFITMSIVILSISPVIYLTVMLLSLLSAVAIVLMKKKYKIEEQLVSANDRGTDLLLGIHRMIPMLGFLKNSRKLYQDYKKITEERKVLEKKNEKIDYLCQLIMFTCNTLREVLVIILGLVVIKLDVGTIISLINMTSFIGDTCMSIYQSSISFIKVGISAKRYEELQNSEKETVIKTLPQEINQLAATHLGFSYSNDSMVLNDINFDLEKGDILVITGNIGAGKSTLSKIIAGIYSQNSGEIRINQEKADIALLRNNVAYVDQNSQLITGTITQNISSFDENNDSGTITRILESVNLQGWVESLHQKQNTVVNSSNETISGGQRQRISIARALYKKAEILVLDEPTASLDQENRDDLLLLIKSIAKTHMIIIVTHDTAAMGIATKNLVLT